MQIIVNGQRIAIVDDTLVSNSVNIYECEFEFDASWDGFAKTSVWQLNSDEPIEVVINSGVAVIPHEVLVNAGILRIGVYGTKDEKVMPTVWLEKRKVCLGTPTGSIGTEPTPSVYAQILEVATEAKDTADDVKAEWDSVSATAETLPSGSSATASFDGEVFSFGIPKGEQGERGEQGEQGEQGEDGFSPTVSMTRIPNGTELTIHAINGVMSCNILNGEDGAQGAKGDKGDKGDQGIQGETGAKGDKGDKGDTGEVSEADLEEALIDKADIILNTASGTIATFSDGAEMPVKSLEVEINAVQSGSGDPSPTNIRPISGWDAVNVDGRGKNFSSCATADYTRQTILLDIPINFKKVYTYSATATNTGTDIGRLSLQVYKGTALVMQRYTEIPVNTSQQRLSVTVDLTNTDFDILRLMGNGTTSGYNVHLDDIQVEFGSTATDYEPYQGTTYPITLPSTCYGGKIKDGLLTIDKRYYTIADGSSGSNVSSTLAIRLSYAIPNDSITWTDGVSVSNKLICDKFTETTNSLTYNGGIGIHYRSNGRHEVVVGFGAQGTIVDNVDQAREWVTTNTINIVYELATPIEITLSDYPTIETLKGVNNLWADCGDVAVIYRADTKAYIDGTIVDVPLAMIAPIENGTTSSRAYTVGEYFILNGNQFCKALTSIASGATFTLNTNYTVTTIGAELKALQ